MSRFFTSLCTSLCAISTIALYADAPMETMPDAMSMPEFSGTESFQMPIAELTPVLPAPAPVIEEPKVAVKKAAEKKPEVNVNPFTGKIKGRKVRMRLRPDLDSRIIKEFTKNDLVTVVGEKGDFWAVQPPAGLKTYIFRSFVLDNIVEGTRVNVRLEPGLDAPVVAFLNSGDKIENPSVSAVNPKWLEISPPANTRFYIAKEYVEYAGGPEVKIQMERRQSSAEQLLDSSALLAKAELRKPFEEIDFDRIVRGYNTVIHDFDEFPDLVEQAKEALASFQEAYLQHRINYLESQAAIEQYAAQNSRAAAKEPVESEHFERNTTLTDKMRLWEPIEEALYLSWANINDNRTLRDYYDEQKLASVEITGIVEPYTAPVKTKPGDYILRERDIPVGYIYSTQVNLQDMVGKKVRLVATQRPNNNFAFPAYYVLSEK